MKVDDLIDTERLIEDIKKGKGPEMIHNHLMDQNIDVVSLAEIKQIMATESSVGAVEQK